jgi:SOS-response transcriptional repressor LexA
MSTVLERIKTLIDNFSDGNVSKFSRMTSIKYTSIKYWFEKNEANLTAENLEKICSSTDVSADWLLMGRIREYDKSPEKPLKIPIIGWHAADHREKQFMRDKAKKQLTIEGKKGSRVFAVEIPPSYDRMLPRLEPGATIVIDPDRKPKQNSIVLFMQNGETQIGRLQSKGTSRNLSFDNPDYPSVRVDQGIKLLGNIVKIILNVE